jgi:ATP-dependent RNA helicase SUPV3L1/SUV3
LAREPEIRVLAHGRRRVRLLWDACQIPDFRKLADETHTRLCARIFGHIARDGTLPTDWLAGQIAGVERTDGDLDTLMQRLAGIRIWSYIAARSDWVHDAAHWQGRAREVEDKLSDALHERLIARFVDRRATQLMRRLDAGEGHDLLSAVTRRGEVVVEGHQVGHVAGFGFSPDPLAVGDEKKLVWRAARRALREEMPRRVAQAEAAPDSAFGWTDGRDAAGSDAAGDDTPGYDIPAHHLTWDGVAIARLRPGSSALNPRVEVLDSEFLDGAQRERLRTRLQAYVEARLHTDLAPLFAVMAHAEALREARGPVHLLREGLGVVPEAGVDALASALRAQLKQIGVRAGRFAVFVPALLKPRPTAMRARLWALHRGLAAPELPAPGLVSVPLPAEWPPGFAAMAGWVEAGPVLLRLDVAERVAGELAWATQRGATVLPTGLAGRFAVKAELVPAVLRGLGFRVLPGGSLGPGGLGPPAPPMLAPLKRRRAVPAELPDEPYPPGPFAALAALKR